MIQVFSAVSGESVAAFDANDFGEKSVKALKQRLVDCTGYSRFRQRLLHSDNTVCNDDDALTEGSFQLVLLPFCPNDSALARQLRSASQANNLRAVERLLSMPLNPDQRGRRGETALHVAAYFGNFECAQLLIQAGSQAHKAESEVVKTPLHLAAISGQSEVVRMLLAAGAQPDARRAGGTTALQDALARGKFKFGGTTTSQDAVACGRLEVVRVLLEAGANPETEEQEHNYFSTPLTEAASQGHLDLVRLLLAYGAERDRITKGAQAAIHAAAQAGQTEVVRFLLQMGTPVNLASEITKEAPLHLAATKGHLEVVRLLLEFQAEIDQRSSGCMQRNLLFLNNRRGVTFIAGGHTALELATKNRRREVAALLEATARRNAAREEAAEDLGSSRKSQKLDPAAVSN